MPVSWSQSSPDPEQDIGVTVTLLTDSSGIGRATNNSATYHYRGDLSCVSTCPGPEPSGCSTTSVLNHTRELAPGQAASCLMFATTDPCCQDDGHFYISALFSARDYRTSASDPWTPLPFTKQISWSNIEQDAGQGNPGPSQNNPKGSHMSLTASCKCPWTPGCGDPNSNPFAADPPGNDDDEMTLHVDSSARKHNYKIRVRVAGYCPADDPADPNLPYCQCPCGYCDPNVPAFAMCPGVPNPFNPAGVSCHPYPKQFHLPSANPLPPDCKSLNAHLEFMDPADPNVTSDPNTPAPGHWPYCVMIIQPDQGFVRPMTPLNDCCDVGPVQNIVLCAELDTYEVQKPNETWGKVNSPQFDKSYRRRCVDDPNDLDTMQDITCWSDFADPRSPTGICANPI